MQEEIMTNNLQNGVFLLFWSLIYIILGFETTVVALLLFILTKMRNQK